ncbi:small metal-binding protein SmbP [Methylocystis parvus]|uniref:small metal-binding protein SmbP n=1 Tax=Methylocystis parvus TaxID=134 RepID=UPI003C72367E
MLRKTCAALLGLSLTFGAVGAVAKDSHLAEAIRHTREAVAAGREDKPNSLVMHATTALDHAKAAQRERPNAHVKKAVTRLEEAVKFGKAKRRAATTIADRALQELERAPQ